MKIFGFEIGKKQKKEQIPSPVPDKEGVDVRSLYGIQYVGVAQLKTSGDTKNDIKTRWGLYENSEISFAVDEIINELVDFSEQYPIEVKTNDLPSKLATQIEEGTKEVFKFLANDLNNILKKWYVQGAIAFFVQLDKPGKNIIALKEIDVWDLELIRPQKKLVNKDGIFTYIEEEPFWIYTQKEKNGSANKIKLPYDAIIWFGSGLEKEGKVKSYLDYTIKPMNDLLSLENASVIYRITRAPEKRVIYIDTGQLAPTKAEEMIQSIMNRFKTKIEYDTKTGKIKTGNRNVIAATIDYFLPRREGSRGTEVDIVSESSNAISNIIEEVNYFKSKLYQALFIPKSRVTDEPTFNVGASGMISREEVKFSQLISKLEKEFIKGVYKLLKIKLILDGSIKEFEWEEIKQNVNINFISNDFFAKSKRLEVLQQKLEVLRDISDYEGKYFTREDILKKVLELDDNGIKELFRKIAEEEKAGLYDKDDY